MRNSVDDDPAAGLWPHLVQDSVVATMRTVKSFEVPAERLTHSCWIVAEGSVHELDDSRHHPRRKTIQRANGRGTQLDRPLRHLAEPTP